MAMKKRISSNRRNEAPVNKKCFFCEAGKEPSYTDSATLKKYMSDRARIVGKGRTGVCSRHQRVLSKAIKHARHLALLPFVPSL
jgi:small subunit ribosomal protein S18